jgi:proteasome activator subunit 4
MLEYGDSRDRYVFLRGLVRTLTHVLVSFFAQSSQLVNERNLTRQYAGQKVWPRAVFVRQARFYHAARLRWNSIERKRTVIEEQLVDDLVEWSMWHYASGAFNCSSYALAGCELTIPVVRMYLVLSLDT